MTIDDRFTNLVFLLTMAPLAGCPAGDDTSTSDTNSNPTTADMPTSTGPATDTTAEGTDGPATTMNVDTTTDEPTGGTTAEFMCDEEPPAVGAIDPVCTAYVDLYNECYARGSLPQECVDLYAAYCQYDIDYGTTTYGEACGMAYAEFYSCLSQLSCEAVLDDVDDCPDELMAIDTACVKA
jgi:hypothetical protein